MSTVEKYNENEQQEEFVGFRFHPTDQELVRYCLGRNEVAKTSNKVLELEDKTDLYAKEPWRLTHTETDFFEPNEWYYFVTLAENVTGKLRTSRKVKGETCEGCWKEVLGKLSDVLSEDKREVIGKKRSLSFYVKGESISSGWTMTEYPLMVALAHSKIKFSATLKDHDSVCCLVNFSEEDDDFYFLFYFT